MPTQRWCGCAPMPASIWCCATWCTMSARWSRALAAERMAVPVVACGTGDDAEAAARAIRDGAREFLPLPPDPDLIAAILEAAAGESHAMVVRDPAMQATVHRAEQVAASEASVLITGESGTGKEVLARHIHRRSRRSAGPFVALNCAAIPENLLESELFGHEKGAFSGAVARRVGKFEAADGGTLLLDEISEMDIRACRPSCCARCRRGRSTGWAAAAPVRVNVRILATTNRDLPADVQRGTFREDLYFRLNVVSLRIPPLRERPGDIAALADHFARRYAEVNGLPFRPLSREALLRLTSHARGAAMCASWRTSSIARCCSPTVRRSASTRLSSDRRLRWLQAPVGGGIASLVGRRMEEVERDLIIETLGHTLGNRTHAATILGISIRALRNKLRDYAAHGVAVPPPAAGVAA